MKSNAKFLNKMNKHWLNAWQLNQIDFHRKYVNENLIGNANRLNLSHGDRILVPLCGKTRDMMWLVEKGYQVIGIELSPIACDEFFSEIKKTPTITYHENFIRYQSESIELLCGDIFKLTPKDLPTINAIYDCKALISFPDIIRKNYVKQLVDCCGSQVKILLISFELDPEFNSAPFSVTKLEIQDLFYDKFNTQLLNEKKFTEIPKHLLKRGCRKITESVYLFFPKLF